MYLTRVHTQTKAQSSSSAWVKGLVAHHALLSLPHVTGTSSLYKSLPAPHGHEPQCPPHSQLWPLESGPRVAPSALETWGWTRLPGDRGCVLMLLRWGVTPLSVVETWAGEGEARSAWQGPRV